MELQAVSNFNTFHVFVCPEALALLNPICCVVTGVPATDCSLSYFLSLSGYSQQMYAHWDD